MNDLSSRLTTCFLSAFPDLRPSDVPQAAQASLVQWDSVAHVILLSAVCEEFAVELDDEAFESLTSYQQILQFVENRVR